MRERSDSSLVDDRRDSPKRRNAETLQELLEVNIIPRPPRTHDVVHFLDYPSCPRRRKKIRLCQSSATLMFELIEQFSCPWGSCLVSY